MSEAEPLAQHPMYCKIRTVGRGQRSFVQVARNKATNELVAIRFIPRGWEPSHTKYVARAILNHQELSLSKHPHVQPCPCPGSAFGDLAACSVWVLLVCLAQL
ncbi:sulfur stress regulator [Haematococcus lacustris]|uniref:Sulfur stress regulator n=1 Tax=Haematococcus lacustris TaxID=44745 RepID=A0A699Z967_HAELA|nr:sulfur stress regulator [Haematococcus lacustris]